MRLFHNVLLTGLLLGAGFAGPAFAQNELVYVQPLQPQGVQSVQQSLRNAGFYNGRIDGMWGPDSHAALEHYQQTHQLLVTGQMNQATAASLGIAPDMLVAPQTAAAAPFNGGALRPAAVQSVQARLRGLGFYNGSVDGVWGAGTQEAIERFQQGRGLQPNGQLNPVTLNAMGLGPEVLATR
jgi:peptidoglycan hydrolase-like protein with peptidoglycan-binding domain